MNQTRFLAVFNSRKSCTICSTIQLRIVLIVAAFCFLLAARFSRFSRSLSLAKNSQALESWRAIRFRFRFPFRFASIVQMFHYLTDFSWPAKPTQPAVCCGPKSPWQSKNWRQLCIRNTNENSKMLSSIKLPRMQV